jgi:hypothetical protein
VHPAILVFWAFVPEMEGCAAQVVTVWLKGVKSAFQTPLQLPEAIQRPLQTAAMSHFRHRAHVTVRLTRAGIAL